VVGVDSDGDGLSDWFETNFDGNPAYNPYHSTNNPTGTDLDVTTPDTDGDEMPDGWEVQYGLDPRVNDSALDADYDGVNNLTEYQAGTNPNDQIIADGDVNDDAAVNIVDYLLLQRHMLELISLTPQQIAHGDLYPADVGDGVITLSDLILLQRMILSSP
jgi:hypothetical protein